MIMLKRLVNFRNITIQNGTGIVSLVTSGFTKKFDIHRTIFINSQQWQNDEENKKLKSLNHDKKKKVIELEMYVARQEGRKVPDPGSLKPEHWEYLQNLKSRSARTKYYTFLWHIEKKKESREKKKIEKQIEISKRIEEQKKNAEENNHILYALNHTSIFLRVYDSTINFWNNHRLMRAMQFGEKVILDCSYDEYMSQREAINAAKQLMLCFADNRVHDDPFDLHFCNTNMKGTTMKYLQKHIPTLMDPEFPLNVHEKCFTEIFPKERLVYLTPHCRTDLVKYNPDDIYIIGAMVDKINNEPLSLAKAKKLGLRMAKFPLDYYLQWGSGSGKSLTLNQVVSILLDLKKTDDWNYALRHVPRRKVIDINQEDSEEEVESRAMRKLRSNADKFKFDIDTWGSNKKRRMQR